MSAQHEKHPETRLKHSYMHAHKLEVLIKSPGTLRTITEPHHRFPALEAEAGLNGVVASLTFCGGVEVQNLSGELLQRQNTCRNIRTPSEAEIHHTHQKRKRKEDEDLFKRSWMLEFMSGRNMVSFPDGDLVWPLDL